MPSTINISDIVSKYGAYYVNSGQNANRIYQQIFTKSEMDDEVTELTIDGTRYEKGQVTLDAIRQAWQGQWTPKGTVNFTGDPINLFKIKMDFEFTPDDLQYSWLAFLEDVDKADRSQWNFIRWFIEKLYVPKNIESRELNSVYKGVYAAPTPGTPGADGAEMDGWEKIIADHVAAGDITALTTPASLSADPVTFVGEVEDWCDLIPEKYRMMPMTLKFSPAAAQKYARGFRIKYKTGIDYNRGASYEVVDTNITVKGYQAMTGKQKWFCTPKGNMLKIKRSRSNSNMPMVKLSGSNPRAVQLFGDYYEGLGFALPELVFMNDKT